MKHPTLNIEYRTFEIELNPGESLDFMPGTGRGGAWAKAQGNIFTSEMQDAETQNGE